MAESLLPKQMARVRFPSPAPPSLRLITVCPLFVVPTAPSRCVSLREDSGCPAPATATTRPARHRKPCLLDLFRVRHSSTSRAHITPGTVRRARRPRDATSSSATGCCTQGRVRPDSRGAAGAGRCHLQDPPRDRPRRRRSRSVAATNVSRARVRWPGAAATWPSTVRSPHVGTRRTGGSRPVAARRGRRGPGGRHPRRRRPGL